MGENPKTKIFTKFCIRVLQKKNQHIIIITVDRQMTKKYGSVAQFG